MQPAPIAAVAPTCLLLALLLTFCGSVRADWSGVLVDLYDGESDWRFDDSIREAQVGSINFRIEETTANDLRIGVHIGHMSVRVAGDTAAATRRYDAQGLGVFLRQPVPLSDRISLLGELEFRYHSGSQDDGEERIDIDWSEVSLGVGIGLRLGRFRLEPYASYTDLDGDIGESTGTFVFERDDPVTVGLRLDYFVETTGFVRLDFESGGSQGVRLAFVRRY